MSTGYQHYFYDVSIALLVALFLVMLLMLLYPYYKNTVGVIFKKCKSLGQTRSGKIALLLLLTVIIFYLVYPKYYFLKTDRGVLRCNVITGTTKKVGQESSRSPR